MVFCVAGVVLGVSGVAFCEAGGGDGKFGCRSRRAKSQPSLKTQTNWCGILCVRGVRCGGCGRGRGGHLHNCAPFGIRGFPACKFADRFEQSYVDLNRLAGDFAHLVVIWSFSGGSLVVKGTFWL